MVLQDVHRQITLLLVLPLLLSATLSRYRQEQQGRGYYISPDGSYYHYKDTPHIHYQVG